MFGSILAAVVFFAVPSGPATSPSTQPIHPQFDIQNHRLVVLGDEKTVLPVFYVNQQNTSGIYSFTVKIESNTTFVEVRWNSESGAYYYIRLTQTNDKIIFDYLLDKISASDNEKDFETLYRDCFFRRHFNQSALAFWNQTDLTDTAIYKQVENPKWQPSKELVETFKTALPMLNSQNNKDRRIAVNMIQKTGREGIVYIFRQIDARSVSSEQRNWLSYIIMFTVLPEDSEWL